MLNKIDQIVEIILKSKSDKKKLTLALCCLISFGVAVGAATIYESMVSELEGSHRPSYSSDDYDEDEDY